MSPNSRTPPDPAFLDALRTRMAQGRPVVSFADYMDCALYHPVLGYYSRKRKRVGHRHEADFYTASSLGQVFTALVLSALDSLTVEPLENFSLVEIGPESDRGILSGMDSQPFRDYRQIRFGDPLDIPSSSIVFSNELFDAQPFHRFIRKGQAWREMGVTIAEDRLDWCLLQEFSIPDQLPEMAPDGYVIDWPAGAHNLMDRIVSSEWSGLLVAFDYGLPLETILHQRPEGTARTYQHHRPGTDLLDQPGEIDLTCHVIWDSLEHCLGKNGFCNIQLEYQESFFMHHAQSALRNIIEPPQTGFSRDKQTLMELLHPDNMGRKFQVLHAKRSIR